MNTQLTSFHRRITAVIAVACTLGSITSAARAEEWNPHMHGLAHDDRFHQEDRMHENRAMPERDFDMHRGAPPIRNEPARFATPRGTVVAAVPSGAVVVPHAGVSYSFHNGVWYRPYGPRFVVVAAPIGAFIPVLPPFYTTVWFGGLPYYYADDVYYSWRPEQSSYQVVTPPPGAPEPVVNGDRLYAYPLDGQSPDQQSRDRYDCHVWSTNETGADPSQNANAMTATQSADYDRAMNACLSGRGYSVK